MCARSSTGSSMADPDSVKRRIIVGLAIPRKPANLSSFRGQRSRNPESISIWFKEQDGFRIALPTSGMAVRGSAVACLGPRLSQCHQLLADLHLDAIHGRCVELGTCQCIRQALLVERDAA